jgi:hypothetical protein
MKTNHALLCACLAWTGVAAIGSAATTLTFDDFSNGAPPNNWTSIPNGYGGLHWSNFGAIDTSGLRLDSGYRIGTISPNNVAFNLAGGPASISRATGFDLHSGYLTMSLDTRSGTAAMHVRVQGSVSGVVTHDRTYTISNIAPTFVEFNYVGVDRVIFVSSPDTPFALENLTVTVLPPETACTFLATPHQRAHGPGAESGFVTVATQAGCGWGVVNTNSWVTILSPAEQSGPGVVEYSVEADATGAGRSGSISIAGQSFAVSQSVPKPAGVELLTFDDILPLPIEHGYGGLRWDNFGVLDAAIKRTTSGYRIGMVSRENVAFNMFGAPASISSDTRFSLVSAYLTRSLDTRAEVGPMQIRVQGWQGATAAHDNTFTVSNTAPSFVEFNYQGVDRVTFTSSPSSPFAMDNLTVIVPQDSDGDGVTDETDECPNSMPGVVVNAQGCSVGQLAPCAGPIEGGNWRNHGQYVAAVARVAGAFHAAGLITAQEVNELVRTAANSDCGK